MRRRVRLIVIGTLPVVVAGLLGGATIEDMVRTPDGHRDRAASSARVVMLLAERVRLAGEARGRT